MQVRYYIAISYSLRDGQFRRGHTIVSVLQDALNDPLTEETIMEIQRDIEKRNATEPGTVILDYIYRLFHESEIKNAPGS